MYSYNGYEFFPAKAPRYWIPQDGIEGNELVPLMDDESFLVASPFRVIAYARFYREVTLLDLRRLLTIHASH